MALAENLRPKVWAGVLARLFPSVTNQNRNQLVDVLRGISIMMVVFSHYRIIPELFGSTTLLFRRDLESISSGMGYYGVSVFFTISGFLITSISLKRYVPLPTIDFSGFWWLRFSRVVPMLVLTVVTMVLFHKFQVRTFVFSDTLILKKAIASIFSFHFYEVMGTDPGLGAWNVLWSLSVEEMFYLAFPFACLCLNGRGAIIWVSSIIISSAIYFRLTGFGTPFSTAGCIDQLAIGCLLALARVDRLKNWGNAWIRFAIGICLIFGCLFIIFYCVTQYHPFEHFTWTPLLCSLGAAAFLVASQILAVPRYARIVLWPLSALGVLSYEIYLLHMPTWLYYRNFDYHAKLSALFAAIVLSLIIHEFFSEPINKLLRQANKPQSSEPSNVNVDAKNSTLKRFVFAAAIPVFLLLILIIMVVRNDNSNVVIKFEHIASLPPGSSEPIISLGRTMAGDQLLLRHDPDDKVLLGIEHWAIGTAWSRAFSPKELEDGTIDIHFGRLDIVVSRNGEQIIKSGYPPYTPYGTFKVGVNNVGFPGTMENATSKVQRIR